MIKKLSLLLAIFILLISVNFYFIFKSNTSYQKDANIKRILNEIAKSQDLQEQFNSSSGPVVLGAFQAEVETGDSRTANLKNFFRKYNSDLYDYADLIVKVSDEYKFDYRLLPAIAMQESNLCRVIPDDSHNCWGWGIYGTTVTKFDTYDEAIETVAKGIKTHYIDHGLLTATAIMEKYTPSSKGSWAHGVNTFLKMLE